MVWGGTGIVPVVGSWELGVGGESRVQGRQVRRDSAGRNCAVGWRDFAGRNCVVKNREIAISAEGLDSCCG